MTYPLPQSLIGTTRVGHAARASFGEFLDAAADNGQGALLTEGRAWVWDTLRSRADKLDILALVPDVASYAREATDHGMVGAGWRRLRRLGLVSLTRLGIQGFCKMRGVWRRDFPTLLTLLLEMEMASFRRVSPPVVFLHAQITDLVLAMDNAAALGRALTHIRRGFAAEPGLATNNLGTLLPRLWSWGLEVPYLLTPMHPRGHGMRPSKQVCEDNRRIFKGQIIATLETALDASIAAYWRAEGVVSAVYDAAEPNLKQWEQWRNWPRLQEVQTGGEVLTEEACLL